MAEAPAKRPLLPPGTPPFSRKLARALADIEDVPVPLRDLRRAETCPEPLLTWLAWERSVDRWDEAWPVAQKRQAIAQAFAVHQRKGTLGAVRRVVAALGYGVEVREWWQTQPAGPRGTAQVAIDVRDIAITEPMFAELRRLLDDAWRLSIHITDLALRMQARARLTLGLACYDGDELTVWPYTPAPIEISSTARLAAAEHSIDTLTVYPS